ncbi:imidazole glycerol phosphate synthase subunit HisH [uncultured Amphritea sp.]|uniref:imidazole glycerol phosphate synthase subunit HisH n=1 Tax=uncultured Amphritea sp. TaxID=981605 RepID=UPI00263778E0|nr:imidazole glycerol phosphate synthase subunit HisH [uncultured Amphritea sp.]
MSNIIGVVNYGVAGNIHSICKALRKADANFLIVEEASQLESADKILLPGVGSFKDAIQELKNDRLLEGLISAIRVKPTLGICIGMQILSRIGFEFGETAGLGLIDAEVKPVICSGSVPHVGFNNIRLVKESPLLNGLDGEQFYFMHSYEVVNYTDIAALTTYCNHDFVSAISKGHIHGVQFHPEKSRDAGIELFKNFIEL